MEVISRNNGLSSRTRSMPFFRKFSICFCNNLNNTLFFSSRNMNPSLLRMSTRHMFSRLSVIHQFKSNQLRQYDNLICRYASSVSDKSESSSVASSIAKDILASKIKEEEKNDGKSSNSEADDEAERKDKENKSRALKFSFIATGIIGLGITGTLIQRWGE